MEGVKEGQICKRLGPRDRGRTPVSSFQTFGRTGHFPCTRTGVDCRGRGLGRLKPELCGAEKDLHKDPMACLSSSPFPPEWDRRNGKGLFLCFLHFPILYL